MIDRFAGPNRWLSNFWTSVIWHAGIRYPTVENAYQAAKFGDVEIRKLVAALKPGAAKRYASDRFKPTPEWLARRVSVMEVFLRLKFEKGGELAERLDDTGNIEGNDWGDQFWGVCNGVGENNLGKLLMKIRGENREV